MTRKCIGIQQESTLPVRLRDEQIRRIRVLAHRLELYALVIEEHSQAVSQFVDRIVEEVEDPHLLGILAELTLKPCRETFEPLVEYLDWTGQHCLNEQETPRVASLEFLLEFAEELELMVSRMQHLLAECTQATRNPRQPGKEMYNLAECMYQYCGYVHVQLRTQEIPEELRDALWDALVATLELNGTDSHPLDLGPSGSFWSKTLAELQELYDRIQTLARASLDGECSTEFLQQA